MDLAPTGAVIDHQGSGPRNVHRLPRPLRLPCNVATQRHASLAVLIDGPSFGPQQAEKLRRPKCADLGVSLRAGVLVQIGANPIRRMRPPQIHSPPDHHDPVTLLNEDASDLGLADLQVVRPLQADRRAEGPPRGDPCHQGNWTVLTGSRPERRRRSDGTRRGDPLGPGTAPPGGLTGGQHHHGDGLELRACHVLGGRDFVPAQLPIGCSQIVLRRVEV